MSKYLAYIATVVVLLQVASASDIIDLTCENDTDCDTFQHGAVNSTCVAGQCHCIDNTTGKRSECKPRVSKASNLIGGHCPCIPANSFCHEKSQLCVCKEGYQPDRESKKCIEKSVALGKNCEIDEQCLQYDYFSRCHETTHNCTCSNHFVIFADKCHSIIAAGNSTCEKNSDCSDKVANSSCHEHQCICSTGFVADSANTTCLPVALHEEPCLESNQCIAQLGVGSLCSNGKCVCNDQYFAFPVHSHNNATSEHKVLNICTRKITQGTSCSDNKDCYQFHRGPHEQTMECFMGECVCSPGNYEKGGICVSYSSATDVLFSPTLVVLVLIVGSYFHRLWI
ncbi:tenascin [Wyeomyia smithii]|uniref:tenascin n=1 Tax=Wyeomyia smithii TaxID=174621 RepID=UPI002467D18F|nr:tenascin [Wyeomyia smithii]